MTPTEPPAPKNEDWFAGVPSEGTGRERGGYIRWSLATYQHLVEVEVADAGDLRDFFMEEFQEWTVNAFRTVHAATLGSLRVFLRKHGVYVPKARNL